MYLERSIRGFTLIELMIVVAIIGILAAIAYPAYQDQMRKTRRADAQGALLSFANAMERYYTEQYTYTGASPGGGDDDTGPPSIFPTQAPLDGSTKYYNLTIQTATDDCDGDGTSDDPCYTIRATPIGGGAQDGDGYLEVTSTGARRWDRNNDGDTADANEDAWG